MTEDQQNELRKEINNTKNAITKELHLLQERIGLRVTEISLLSRESSSPAASSPIIVSVDITLSI